MWDDQDLAEVTLTCSPPNVCGGEHPMDESEKISSPPQEFGGTDYSKKIKHPPSSPNIFWGEDPMNEIKQTSSTLNPGQTYAPLTS